MQTILNLLSTLLPILLAILIGVLCRRMQILSQHSIDDLRTLISSVFIPCIIVKAFYTLELNRSTAIEVGMLFLAAIAAMLLGYPLRRFFGSSGYAVPFLCTSYEGGMLGYSLYSILMGEENLQYFARADIGPSLFVFSVFLMMMLAHNTGSVSVRAAWDVTRKAPSFWALVLGLILVVSGGGRFLSGSAVGPLISDTLSFLTQPVSMIVLIIIGYNFRLDPRVNRRAIRMLLCRYAVQGVLALILFPLLIWWNVLDYYATVALVLMMLLPPSFMVPVILDTDEETSSFISILMSIGTIVGIFAFLIIKIIFF
ncbi:MAG: hypothetical protein ACI4PM_06020 [Butyricicoccus sp.]